jgi:hypothetical protein
MAAPRKILANAIMLTGIGVGAAAAAMWAYLMWPLVSQENYQGHNALRHLFLDIGGGIVIWCVVAWPFLWVAGRLDPSPQGPEEIPAEPTTAPRSRPAHSRASRQTTPPR